MPQVYSGEDGIGAQLNKESLAAGQEILPRTLGLNSTAAVSLSSQALRLGYFGARRAQPSTGIRLLSGSTAAGATPTLCRIGLYRIQVLNQVLSGVLVASTANDTALFAAANTAYSRDWSAPYQVVAGEPYAVGILVVTGAAAPNLAGQSFAGGNTAAGNEALLSPRLSGLINSQSDLPASFAESSVVASAGRAYGVLLP